MDVIGNTIEFVGVIITILGAVACGIYVLVTIFGILWSSTVGVHELGRVEGSDQTNEHESLYRRYMADEY